MEHEIYRFPRERLDALVERLAREYRVVGPVVQGSQHAWSDVRPGTPLALDYPTTLLPPRQFFAPPREVLYRYRTGDDGTVVFEPPVPDRPVAVLGVHGCDLTGMRVLRSFHEASCGDRMVTDRLDQSFILGIACWAPCMAEAFCRDMGSLENEIPGDLYAWDLGAILLMKVLKARGREVLADVAPLEAATAEEQALLKRRLRARHDAFPTHLSLPPAKLPVALEAAADNLLWEANAERCLSCGRCNLVCPTCTCFDVHDVGTLDGRDGERVRSWHGCQIPGFAKVAGGHDFRPARAQQLRYRIFRKGKYMPELYGMVGCTGCGRCVKHCPTHISIRDIFRQVGGAA